jgi:hypothetical protein
MARINVRLDDVESSSFELFPEGGYIVEIQPSTKLKSSKDGNPGILVIAKCVEGEMEEKVIAWNLSLLPSALWNLKAMMEAMSLEWEEDGFDLESLFEEKVGIRVTHREYPSGSGIIRNQVEGYFIV